MHPGTSGITFFSETPGRAGKYYPGKTSGAVDTSHNCSGRAAQEVCGHGPAFLFCRETSHYPDSTSLINERKGKTVLKTKDIMTRDIVTVSPETEITLAAKLLLEKGINGAPVVDKNGKLVGIICQSDLIAQQKSLPMPSVFTLLDGYIPLTIVKSLEKAAQKIAATRVADAMTPDPVTIQSDTGVEELANLMVDKKLYTLPVVDDEKLVGVVGKEDILKTLTSESKSE
jgi:CBS-domain-containing membrane protein